VARRSHQLIDDTTIIRKKTILSNKFRKVKFRLEIVYSSGGTNSRLKSENGMCLLLKRHPLPGGGSYLLKTSSPYLILLTFD
jgi:hypothetical protein